MTDYALFVYLMESLSPYRTTRSQSLGLATLCDDNPDFCPIVSSNQERTMNPRGRARVSHCHVRSFDNPRSSPMSDTPRLFSLTISPLKSVKQTVHEFRLHWDLPITLNFVKLFIQLAQLCLSTDS
jgi:hypothetical protein